MTVANVSQTLSGMGRRLREIRLERGISLRELARRLELSPSAVSKIETGKMQPSVRTLHALVAEFDLSVDEVFTEQRSSPSDTFSARTPARARGAACGGPTGRRPELRCRPGAPDVLRPARTSSSSRRRTRPAVRPCRRPRSLALTATEFGYILSGVLRVVLGTDSVILSAGDSITLPSSTPHRLFNDGPEHVRAIWAVRGGLGLDLGPDDHGGGTT